MKFAILGSVFLFGLSGVQMSSAFADDGTQLELSGGVQGETHTGIGPAARFTVGGREAPARMEADAGVLLNAAGDARVTGKLGGELILIKPGQNVGAVVGNPGIVEFGPRYFSANYAPLPGVEIRTPKGRVTIQPVFGTFQNSAIGGGQGYVMQGGAQALTQQQLTALLTITASAKLVATGQDEVFGAGQPQDGVGYFVSAELAAKLALSKKVSLAINASAADAGQKVVHDDGKGSSMVHTPSLAVGASAIAVF